MPADLSTPEARAAYLARLGIRVPLRPVMSAGRTIVDADDHPVAVVLLTGGTTADRARSIALAMAVNEWCGLAKTPIDVDELELGACLDPAAEAALRDPCDPPHIAVVAEPSRQNYPLCAPMSRRLGENAARRNPEAGE